MGASGVRIFSDDLAMDVRDDYHEYAGFIEDESELVEKLKGKHRESLALDDERPIFWYALALCQWKCGRLQEDVKNNALYYIDHPDEDGNLQIWKEGAETAKDDREKKVYRDFFEERKKVLQEVKSKLTSPLPPLKPRKIKTGKPPLFAAGDIVRVDLNAKAFKRFRRPERFFSEEQLKKIEQLFNDNHFYIIKASEEKERIDELIKEGEEDDEKSVFYYEYFCIFDWIGKEELTLEQIAKLPVANIPTCWRDGEIDDRYPSYKLYRLSNYELCYPDSYSYHEGRYFKVSQLEKVYNDKTLIPQLEDKEYAGELLRKAVMYFALLK